MHQVGITLGRPCVIAQAPPDLREWGPYQFPKVERLEDGRLRLTPQGFLVSNSVIVDLLETVEV